MVVKPGRGAVLTACGVAPGMGCDNQVAAFGERAGTRSLGMPTASASSGLNSSGASRLEKWPWPFMMCTVAPGIAWPMKVAKAAGGGGVEFAVDDRGRGDDLAEAVRTSKVRVARAWLR